jgi:homoserine kinase type II
MMLARLVTVIELAPVVVERLRTAYDVEVRGVRPLPGGYDVYAQSWRIETDRGALVVRADRGVSRLTAGWLSDVMLRAADAGVPCARPLHAADGAAAFSSGGATFTVRAFVEGCGLDRDDPAQLRAAGATLGRLHGALAGACRDRPAPSPWADCFWPADHDPPALRDGELDAWHDAFAHGASGRFAHGVVHGDFWADNVIWDAGRVAAVIDWSEARVDVLARELAWATWEFGHDEASRELDVDRARTFLKGFHAVRERWEPRLADVLIPLMRVELRRNARYALADGGDAEYATALQHAFVTLRHQSAARLLDS